MNARTQSSVGAGADSAALRTLSGPAASELMPIVITGHVDHGKSTVIGRLLFDTGSLPVGKLEAVRASCERNAKPFEYAFLLDALKDEQAQGITIDAARVFFRSARRHYIIIDAPGHIEFLKNMVTGAARARAALLVLDARHGIRENSRRHGYLLSMLGIRQIAVLINKMDLVGYDRSTSDRLASEFTAFLAQLDIRPAHVIPVCGFTGDNIAARSKNMSWYSGPTVLEALDDFVNPDAPVNQPFRMPVQGVYKFTAQKDDRRIIVGTVESGSVRVGDEVVFYPSGKRSSVRSFEAFNRFPQAAIRAGQAAAVTLNEQVFVTRGEIVVRKGEPPPLVSTRIRVSLFWLGRHALVMRKDYVLRLGTARVPARVESIHRVMDASALASTEGRDRVERHEVADCTLVLGRALAFDANANFEATGRFVIVDAFDISGGGTIREALPDSHGLVRGTVLRRNLEWASGGVAPERRAERLSQRPALLLITGERAVDRKRIARELESCLFEAGRFVYFLPIGNLLRGVDADLERGDASRGEHIRRLGEVANILLDAGMIVIATAIGLTQYELETVRTTAGRERVVAVWLGQNAASDIRVDLLIDDAELTAEGTSRVKVLLEEMGVVFRPW